MTILETQLPVVCLPENEATFKVDGFQDDSSYESTNEEDDILNTAPSSVCEDPLLEMLLGIKTNLEQNGFVYVDDITYKQLLVWQGAALEDLQMLEDGKIHTDVAPDPEGIMNWRQIAFHRVLWRDDVRACDGTVICEDAGTRGVTQICSTEISNDEGARIAVKRSGTRYWPLPPMSYAESSIPHAMARVNSLLAPKQHQKQANLDMESPLTINDQVLIRVTKCPAADEAEPTPEGVHKDGTEISSVTMIGCKHVTSGGNSRIWPNSVPNGNYDVAGEDGPSLQHCLLDHVLTRPWETLLFNDRHVKHEARAFDGPRPCSRDVIVNFIRKPLSDGSDQIIHSGR